MQKYVFLFCLVLLSFSSFCQADLKKVDSLIADARYPEAKALIQQLAAEGKSSGLLSNRLAEVLLLEGKLDDAERVLKQVPTSDEFIHAVTETNLGFLYLNRARIDLALDNLQNALTRFQDAGKGNTREAARCLANLSSLYLATGKFHQAEQNGLIALQIRQSLFGENSEEVAASYNDLGLVYSASDPDKALEYYDKALAIYEKVHGKDHPKIAIASNNLGATYRQLELYGDAVNNFETALAIWRKVYPEGHPNEAAALINLGRTYSKMGNKTSALEYYQKAIAIYKKFYGDKHPDIAAVLNLVAVLRLEESLFDDALTSLQEAITANAPLFNSKVISKNPRSSDFYNGKVMLFSLRMKAETLEARHYGKTLKLEDLVQALGTLAVCDTLLDNIRHQSSDESDKLELGDLASEVYEDGVRISQAMSEISLDNEHFRQVSFYFAEKSKSAVLQESIADAEAKSFSGIPEDLLEQEKNLKATISFLSQKLSQKPSEEEEKYLREALFSTNREYDAFTKKLEVDYPKYYNLKFNSSSPTVADLQKTLDSRTAIVSYFIAEKGKRIYHYTISAKRFKVTTVALPDNFNKYTKGLSNALLFGDIDTYNQVANNLSSMLTRHLPKKITDLIIIPSGRLGTVPFEALFYKKNRSRVYAEMPLLVDRYAISYEFSAGLLVQKSKGQPSTATQSIFLCAPVNFPAKDNVAELPGTEAEVTAIAALFGSQATLIAKFHDANEELVKSGKLSDYNYLHFATHGIVDETNPEQSRIYLQDDSQEDGNLFAGEIYNLKLNADLTVLSACQTGLGKFSKGEGVIGLSRALVYAGSRSIIVSFWSVADESTSQLMTDFYTFLLKNKNMNLRTALQKAKLKMLRSSTYDKPFYWAPFILIGS